MSYVALYRKFRPQGFNELVGQEHIVRTLMNQLESGRIAHAYLFQGPRGTGKTSTAKLFARAINCASLVDGNPCGKCDACLASQADDNMDIIEIDAASNNGVDNIRDIRDKVVFAPAYGKYKVYIIDEVHMLSGGAFNALLKTLEEPPAHVVFILATTEIHKLPATILSRCQRFDFKLIASNVIADRLSHVLNEVGAEFEEAAIELIAKSASGGMRDALSLADVCLSYCGKKVTYEDAANVLGISDRSFVFSFADAIFASDTALALDKCRQLETEGRDIGVFVLEMMEHMRDVMLTMLAPESEELTALTNETRERLKKQAQGASVQRVLRSIEILSQLESELKLHNRPEIQLETAVARITMPQLENDITALEDRIHVLEEKLRNGAVAVKASPAPDLPWTEEKPVAPERPAVPERPAMPERPAVPEREKPAPVKKAPAASGAAGGQWSEIIARIKKKDVALYMMLRAFNGAVEGDKYLVYLPEDTTGRKLEIVEKAADAIAEAVAEVTGLTLKVEGVMGSAPAVAEPEKKKAEEQSGGLMEAALDLFS